MARHPALGVAASVAHIAAPRPVHPAAPRPVPYPNAPPPPAGPPSPFGGRYTLDMDPEVVAALYQEQQGLSDLNNSPMPGMPSTASYDMALAHLQQDKPIQLERLNYAFGLNKGNLEHSNAISLQQIVNSLAARNMLRSGAKGSLTAEQGRNYNTALTDLTTKDQWARQDIDRNIQRQQEAISAARAAANTAYQEAVAARQQNIQVSARQLHNSVINAYVQAYQRVISNPALYLGADPNFDPRAFLSQVPTS